MKPESVAVARSRGNVLLLTMLYTLSLMFVAATVMSSAALQLHMAGNDQFQEEAIEAARSIAREIAADRASFDLQSGVGFTRCQRESTAPDCDRRTLYSAAAGALPDALQAEYRVTRAEPLLLAAFPLREPESSVSSARGEGIALFEIDVTVRGDRQRLGNAHVARGIALRLGGRP